MVDNAIKFTEQGEVVLGLDAAPPDAGATRLRITVRDRGIGIPAAQRSRIFQHFTRADSSTTRKHGGTGAGLAICRQLVELMRGRTEAENEEGRGTTLRSKSDYLSKLVSREALERVLARWLPRIEVT